MKRSIQLVLAICLVVFLFLGSTTASAAKRELRSSWSWPTYIDPAVGSDYSSSAALVNLYDTLVYPDKNENPQPHLSTKWTYSPDGLVWTFYLRKGVKFHDGTELTSEDVKFSMERMLTIGEGYGYLFSEKGLTVSTKGKYTVVFKFDKPNGPFLVTLYRFPIVNKKLVTKNFKKPGAYGKMGDYGKKFLLTNDAGSGPYMVKKFKFEEYLTMTKNPDYFLPIDPKAPDELKMIGTTEAVTVKSLMSRKELEISDQWQTVEAINALNRIPGVKDTKLFMGSVFYFMMHTKKAPTDDIHFRKAMAYAMDYDTVVKRIFPGSKLVKGPVSESMPGHDPTVKQYKRDLKKAKEELRKSKYWGKLDQYPVEVHWVAEVPDEEKVALLFMFNMAQIGIDVKVVKVPWMTVVEESANMETSPHIVTIFDTPGFPEAGSVLHSRYHSTSAPTWEQNEWLLDTNFDTMLEDALSTVNQKQRFKKYRELQHYIVDLCPTLFMFDQVIRHAYNEDVLDWPVTRGEMSYLMGYVFAGRFMKIK